MKRYFACSDIHSFYDAWMNALHQKGFDINNSDHIIIICGDLFDRGRQSRECFEFVRQMADADRLVYVRGNHEDLLFSLVHDIDKRRRIGYYHISNGTVQTLADMMDTNIYDVLDGLFEWEDWDKIINSDLLPFITKHSRDFFELGSTVFVHGWLPTDRTSDENPELAVHASWREGDWSAARWENGMEMFKFGLAPKDTTVVCGHWHASWGHNRMAKTSEEWGPTACFKTFMYHNDELNANVIALDACTVYSNFVNCEVFNDEGEVVENV